MKPLEDTFRNAQNEAQNGHMDTALNILNTVSPKDTHRPDFKIFRARILLAIGRDTDALEDINDADDSTASPRLLSLRAEVEEKLGRIDAAIHTLTRALKSGPDASLLARRSILQQAQGNFDKAQTDLLDAIDQRPSEGELYRLHAQLHKFSNKDPMLGKIQTQARVSTVQDQMGFDFAQAKALDDLGDYEKAFFHLKRANAAMRRRFPYDIKTRLDTVQTYKNRFLNFRPSDHTVTDASSYDPIFITGMARSGTTLVEQVISSHAYVQAGGETARFPARMNETYGDPTSQDFNITPEKTALLAQRYHADMLTNLHIAKRHTDKSIQTILYAGPILAALPKAKIIVVTRNANANALSLFKQVFRSGKQLFSYNLEDIRAYQQSFDQITRFWMERIPDAILTVAYEDLVSQPETTIRSMLDFAGLEWDSACLRPEDNKRTVRTLSSATVRKAIDLKAKDHWHNYADHLETS